METRHYVHAMLCDLCSEFKDNQEEHKKFFEFLDGLSGQGIVSDTDLAETLTLKQARSIVLEYITQCYKTAGYQI